jgi:cytochrome c biogenesis protein CcdA
MVSRLEQIDYVKYDTHLFVTLILVLTRKALLFALDLSLGFTSLTSSLGFSANKISYFVRTRLNWNKQICIITISIHFKLLTQKFARQDFWPLKVARLSKIGNPCISQMGSMVTF